MRWDNVYLDGLLLLAALTILTGITIWWDWHNRPDHGAPAASPTGTCALCGDEDVHVEAVRPSDLLPLEDRCVGCVGLVPVGGDAA